MNADSSRSSPINHRRRPAVSDKEIAMADRLLVRIRVVFLLGLSLMGILLLHPARAVEKFRPVLLPDAGHGSTARAVAQMDTFKFGVVGSQRNLDGSSNTIM